MIEKNIPIPVVADRIQYPFATMKTGDSFFVKASENLKNVQAGIHATLGYFKRHHRIGGFKIRTRREADGLRVWRIK